MEYSEKKAQLAGTLELIFRFLREQEDIEVWGHSMWSYLTAFKKPTKPTGPIVGIKVVDLILVPRCLPTYGGRIRGFWIEAKRPTNGSYGIMGEEVVGDMVVKYFELHDPNALQELADFIREQ